MLFTDGLANVGLVKSSEIVKALQQRLDKIDAVCSVFTFGYGADHDQNMLKEIAEAGRGLYYFIEGLEGLLSLFLYSRTHFEIRHPRELQRLSWRTALCCSAKDCFEP